MIQRRSFRHVTIAVALAAAFACATARAEAQSSPCRAFLDARVPDASHAEALILNVRQRVPIELTGYVETGNNRFLDRDASMRWSVHRSNGTPTREASILADPRHNGRAFFHPGYAQGSYVITLDATTPAGAACAPALLRVLVDTDYTQYVEIGGSLRSSSIGPVGRIVDEGTQLSLPLYASVRARAGDIEAHGGLKLADPRIYVGAGYRALHADGETGRTGWGFGAERAPDIDRRFSLAGNIWYYPSLGGLRVLSYGIAATQVLPKNHYFLDAGLQRDHGVPLTGTAATLDHTEPFLMLGIRL